MFFKDLFWYKMDRLDSKEVRGRKKNSRSPLRPDEKLIVILEEKERIRGYINGHILEHLLEVKECRITQGYNIQGEENSRRLDN